MSQSLPSWPQAERCLPLLEVLAQRGRGVLDTARGPSLLDLSVLTCTQGWQRHPGRVVAGIWGNTLLQRVNLLSCRFCLQGHGVLELEPSSNPGKVTLSKCLKSLSLTA